MTDHCGFVIYDTKTKLYYNGRTLDEPDLQAVRARFERVEGAQKEVTNQQSGGYETPEDIVIIPVSMVLGEAIKPKIAKQKQVFVIKIVETIPANQWNKKAQKRVSFYKGNKAKPPEKVDQIYDRITEEYEARRYLDAKEPHRIQAHKQSALWLAHAQWTGYQTRVATEIRATVYPSHAAARRHLDIHNANLDRFYKEYEPKPSDSHRDFTTERDRFKISIEEVK